MTLKGGPKFKGKLTCCLNNDLRNFVNFHSSSRKSGNLHFHGLFLSKAYKDLDEKVKIVMPHYTEAWCKVWRKTDSWFQNWHDDFGEIKCEQWKVWKFALCCATIFNGIWSFSWKITEELSLITLKEDLNFEEKLTFCLKNDMRN